MDYNILITKMNRLSNVNVLEENDQTSTVLDLIEFSVPNTVKGEIR